MTLSANTEMSETGSISKTARSIHRRNLIKWLLLLAVPIIFLLAFYLYPICRMLGLSIFDPDFTVKHYVHFFNEPAYARVLFKTFRMGISVTIITLLLGYPVAYLLSQVSPKVRSLLMAMVALPFFTAILVRTYAWMILLGRNGLLNQVLKSLGIVDTPLKLMHNLFGVYVGMVQILLPFMILPLYSVMVGIDKRLLAAAANLGANRFRTFIHVFFPLSLPGVGGGSLLVLIIALGFFITPRLLGGPSDVMISMFIESQVEVLLDWGFASAIAVVLLVTTIVIFYFYARFFGVEKIQGQ